MSTALQVALFLAALAIVALVVCVIPLVLQARRSLEHLALTMQELKANMQVLMQDSRELVRSVNELAQRANRQLDEAGHVVRTVRQWTDRADRIVNEVGAVLEPPVFGLVHTLNLFRTGLTAGLQALFLSRRRSKTAATDTENPT